MNNLPKVIGTHTLITLSTGKPGRAVLLNNAATTSPFIETLDTVNEFMIPYGALHRGAGPHAAVTYKKVNEAIKEISRFLNLPKTHSLIFSQNTSSAINDFSRLLKLKKQDVVITSAIEHTSNNLPWHYNTPAKVVDVKAFDDGSIDYQDLEEKAKKYGKNLKLITMTGASNLTGYIPDLKKLSEIAHQHNAMLFIDAAQLAPHRPIDMKADGIDALAFSAHKIYAPFGLGVLALPKKLLDTQPVNPGGGSIDMISDNSILWAPIAERHQIGTWNVTGIIALAKSCEIIRQTGWDKILTHEKELVQYLANRLAKISGLKMYVQLEKYLKENRIGTFPFNLEGYHHSLVSCILENEYGIESRAGTICNHRLVRRWHKISDQEQKIIEKEIKNGNRLASYGIVRISLGIHNTKEDLDLLITALTEIATRGPKLEYNAVPAEEIFVPLDRNKFIP